MPNVPFLALSLVAALAAGIASPNLASAGDAGSGAGAPPADANLSQKLDKSNGVIRPNADVDPKIEKPAPVTGSMPVLRPPAGPGSPSGTQAK